MKYHEEIVSDLNTNEVKFGALLSYLLIALNAVSGFIISPFILKCLGESEYGVYKAVASVTATISVMELGLGGTMQRYIAKFNARNDRSAVHNFSAMGLIESGILSIIILFIGVGIYCSLDRIFGAKFTALEIQHAKQIFWILLFSVICHLYENTLFGVIAGYNQFIFTNTIKIVLLIIRVLLYIFILPLTKNAFSLVIMIVLFEVTTIIAELIFLRKKFGHRFHLQKWDVPLFKESFIYALAMFIQTLAIQFNGNIDNVVIGAAIGTTAVTVYSFSILLLNMYENCSTAISGVMLPTVMNQIESGCSNMELEQTIIKTGRIQWMVLGAILTGFICCGKEFLSLWLGSGYDDCWLLAIILLLPGTIHLITNVGLSVLRAKNLMLFRTVYLLCSAVMNALITFIGTPIFGYWAAAAGTACATLVGDVIILNIYYSKKIKFRMLHIYGAVFHKTTICLAIASGCILMLNHFVMGSWISLSIKITTYLIFYVLTLYLFGMNNNEKHYFKK